MPDGWKDEDDDSDLELVKLHDRDIHAFWGEHYKRIDKRKEVFERIELLAIAKQQ